MPADEPHYTGHRQRLRDRYQRAGADALQDYELLELLLTYALPRRDVKPVAKALMARHGSLAGVLDAAPADLAATTGMGQSSALMLHLVRDVCSHYLHDRLGDHAAAGPAAPNASASAQPVALRDDSARPRLATSQALLDFLRVTLAGQERERLLAVFLDPAWRVISHRILQEGGHDQVAVYPRQIVEQAVRAGAAGIVIAHNHPSGQASPSADDIRVTQAVAAAAALLDIHLIDHVIVADRSWYSFAEHDLIPHT